MARKPKPKPMHIKNTANYDLFKVSAANRPLDLAGHRPLRREMEERGFLPVCPIICAPARGGVLEVKDGQHRLHFARELGLPVYYVETTEEFDVAAFNSVSRGWSTSDYAQVYEARGIKAYKQAIAFSEAHGLPLGVSFALLAGTVSVKNIWADFTTGRYEVKDPEWASAVAQLHSQMTLLAPVLKTSRSFMGSCMAVCRVADFDAKRLVEGARKCMEKLIPYGSREACLAMLEEVYNFRRSIRVGLKSQAEMVMRDRNPTLPKKAA